jgi:hypothetical protein
MGARFVTVSARSRHRCSPLRRRDDIVEPSPRTVCCWSPFRPRSVSRLRTEGTNGGHDERLGSALAQSSSSARSGLHIATFPTAGHGASSCARDATGGCAVSGSMMAGSRRLAILDRSQRNVRNRSSVETRLSVGSSVWYDNTAQGTGEAQPSCRNVEATRTTAFSSTSS